MDLSYSPLNISTAVLVGLTVWMLTARYRGVIESNWPLFYYFGVVAYSLMYSAFLDPAWVYAGVVCGLLLRFEFMGGFFLKLVRLVEFVVLVYILYVTARTLVL